MQPKISDNFLTRYTRVIVSRTFKISKMYGIESDLQRFWIWKICYFQKEISNRCSFDNTNSRQKGLLFLQKHSSPKLATRLSDQITLSDFFWPRTRLQREKSSQKNLLKVKKTWSPPNYFSFSTLQGKVRVFFKNCILLFSAFSSWVF